jgi:MFS family permease
VGTGEDAGAQRWWTLGVMCLSLLIVGIDTSILNVTLPTLVREIGASTSQLQWIVDSYVVVFAGLLLVMGSVADQYGRKGVLTIGLLIFGGGSGLAALSATSTQLIVCRVIMGVGAALIKPPTRSIIAKLLQDVRARRPALANM